MDVEMVFVLNCDLVDNIIIDGLKIVEKNVILYFFINFGLIFISV